MAIMNNTNMTIQVPNQVVQQPMVQYYYHMSTTNKSFLEMHQYLQDIGIRNNSFMLLLLDPDLRAVDPYDPQLSRAMKTKVLRECLYNPWYFFREVVRVPQDGSPSGVKFELHRGNMAALYAFIMNMNVFLELPRQTYKTISTLCWYLYLFNFGTSNAEITFVNKNMGESKRNLEKLKKLRDALPSYLKMDQAFSADGNKIKARNNVETLIHPVNLNKISTVGQARSATAAASLLRGHTTALMYLDEYAFIPYNNIAYTNMVPAFNTASLNAKMHNAPYGIIITTTPGMLTEDMGVDAFNKKEAATRFSERWYDLSRQEIQDIIDSNHNSNFVYIKFTYQQIGKSEEWFKNLCITMGKDWTAIRREVLLEWSNGTSNSPFRAEDLDIIKNLVRQPINTVLLMNKYELKIYKRIDLRYPPLIGVDVAGGYKRDSSAVTIVDSYTTEVVADLNSNFISTPELAKVIYIIVSEWCPNAIVNIERNGGFGLSVIDRLKHTSIKKNLYYTIKDKITEERISGGHIHKTTQKTKIYGSDSTSTERDNLMEILRDRVEYHKDKIVSPTIYEELCGMEVKKSGKIEHSNNTHDDQVFSWLWALYVYYNGTNLMNDWGITKRVLKTDADIDEAVIDIMEEKSDISDAITTSDNEEIQEQLQVLAQAAGQKMFEQWLQEEKKKDDECYNRLMATKPVKQAYMERYNVAPKGNSAFTEIPNEVFLNFYTDEDNTDTIIPDGRNPALAGNLSKYW